MVTVNTVVIVRDGLSRPESAVAVALAALGAGSMAVAFALPRWLERRTDRSVMLTAATAMTAVLALLALLWPQVDVGQRWWLLLAGWAVLVFGFFPGFGLATKLQGFELSPDGLIGNMPAFNVGVEQGQLLPLGGPYQPSF